VLTKGVPLRVNGTTGLDGTVASVDSELTLLYRKLVGDPALGGRIQNPYFSGAPRSLKRSRSHASSATSIVTRLDGFTVDDVVKLIDRAAPPAHDGKIVLDEKATVIDRGGDGWLQQTADRLKTSAADRARNDARGRGVERTGHRLLLRRDRTIRPTSSGASA
jgi:uncharacterized protein (TIGR03790 family)